MKKFLKPELEIVKLDVEDVVYTSGGLMGGEETPDQGSDEDLFGS